MAILAECPICRSKQKLTNKNCKCGEDLAKAKRSKRVKYHISYRLPNGKQRREVVGYSIEDARAAEGKRKAQKKENPKVLEISADNKTISLSLPCSAKSTASSVDVSGRPIAKITFFIFVFF